MVGPEVRGDMLGNGLWLCTLRCQVENDRSRFVPVTPTWDLGVLTVAAATPSPVTVVNHHDYFIFNKGPLLHFAIHCYTSVLRYSIKAKDQKNPLLQCLATPK